MRLTYKILWFEDNIDLVKDYEKKIEKFLEEFGFICEIIHQENGGNLYNLIENEFDLILTDFNLEDNEEETGNIIIDRIRKHKVLTEVLFYSGNSTEIEEVIKGRWVERVSFSVGIENLLDKIKELITYTIKKVQEANNVRGLVMAETSDLDLRMTDIILDFFKKFQPDDSIIKKEELINKTIENRSGRLKKVQKCTPDTIEELCGRLETSEKLHAIIRLIQHKHIELKESIFTINVEILEQYIEEILHKRNILAHAKEIVDSNGIKRILSLHNGKEFIVDDQSCILMRKNIQRHRYNLEDIMYKISSL